MNLKNRIDRITYILTELSQGIKLSTPDLAKNCEVTKKIIQTDFKEYILPLFDDESVVYNFGEKKYISKRDFLNETPLSAEELSIISIMKNKSKDKYSDSKLFYKLSNLFKNYEKLLFKSKKKNNNKSLVLYDKLEIDLIKVELNVSATLTNYIINNPIDTTQIVIKKYDDGSCDIVIEVSDFIDILSNIQKFMPNIGVRSPNKLKNIIKGNIYNYLKKYD